MDYTTLINSFGFPIACVIVLAYWTGNQSKQTRIDGNAREKTLLDANKEFALALNKASDAITENGKLQVALYERMHTVECKIDALDCKMESIKISVLQEATK